MFVPGGTNKSRRKERPEATVTKNYTAGGNHTGDKALSFEKGGLLTGIMCAMYYSFFSFLSNASYA